jgi:hypothetical protein
VDGGRKQFRNIVKGKSFILPVASINANSISLSQWLQSRAEVSGTNEVNMTRKYAHCSGTLPSQECFTSRHQSQNETIESA